MGKQNTWALHCRGSIIADLLRIMECIVCRLSTVLCIFKLVHVIKLDFVYMLSIMSCAAFHAGREANTC